MGPFLYFRQFQTRLYRGQYQWTGDGRTSRQFPRIFSQMQISKVQNNLRSNVIDRIKYYKAQDEYKNICFQLLTAFVENVH